MHKNTRNKLRKDIAFNAEGSSVVASVESISSSASHSIYIWRIVSEDDLYGGGTATLVKLSRVFLRPQSLPHTPEGDSSIHLDKLLLVACLGNNLLATVSSSKGSAMNTQLTTYIVNVWNAFGSLPVRTTLTLPKMTLFDRFPCRGRMTVFKRSRLSCCSFLSSRADSHRTRSLIIR